MWAARNWGRIYCGWLCPHHWVVELVNGLVRRSCGRRSIWDRAPLPAQQCDGTLVIPDPRYWLPTVFVILLLAPTWTLGFLSYLLPPAELYTGLFQGSLPRGWLLAISLGTTAMALEFTLARHLRKSG